MASFAKTHKTVMDFNIYYLLGIKGAVFGKWIIISTFPKCKDSKGAVWKRHSPLLLFDRKMSAREFKLNIYFISKVS